MLGDNIKYKIPVIAIQGCTASGKTSFAKEVIKRLKENNIKIELISLDNYYKPTGANENLNDDENYDYDNPGAFDWDLLRKTLDNYFLRKDEFEIPIYNFSRRETIKKNIKNTFPDILIIEGLYSFNIFNDEIFNMNEFDCRNSEKNLKNTFVKNFWDFNKFSILKIQLALPFDKILEARIKRDWEERRPATSTEFTKEKWVEWLTARVNKFVMPATRKWIYNDKNMPDVSIEGGICNNTECIRIYENILHNFLSKKCFNEMFLEKNIILK